MKRYSIIILIYISCINLESFCQKPIDGVKVGKNTFIDRTEVTNKEWREFMSWNENKYGKDAPEYKSTVPDTAVWLSNPSNLHFVINYHMHYEYSNHPVVGITHHQANMYCKWKGDRTTEIASANKNTISNINKNTTATYSYRLPTEKEWVDIAQKYHANKEKNKDVPHNFFNYPNHTDGNAPEESISYKPSGGIYNMIGNVAEMTNEMGIAKGGSWFHDYMDFNIERDYNYTKPEKWLGFRCICEIAK